MTIKLIAIDIDGTLVNDKKEIAPETITTIKAAKAAGIKVVLCTGRPLTGVTKYLEKLGLTSDDDFVITFNGALVQVSGSGEVLIHHTLDINDYNIIEETSRELNVHVHAEDQALMYTPNADISEYSVAESFLVQMPIRFRKPEEMDKNIVISKMMYIDYPEVITRVVKELPAKITDNYYYVQSEPYFLELLNKNASKGNAVMSLADKLGFTKDEVMALGDQGNDLSMIQAAGLGVAMGNAIQEVKDNAQAVTATNVELGVAKAIQKYALAD
ncbi:sugar-phosphatase [Dellaglioa sp. P0083]|uniref:sugar-phosphatase n=1 Tax=Dellaglioa kimchii TaxID=3344667 RepID=UPI0038D3B859